MVFADRTLDVNPFDLLTIVPFLRRLCVVEEPETGGIVESYDEGVENQVLVGNNGELTSNARSAEYVEELLVWGFKDEHVDDALDEMVVLGTQELRHYLVIVLQNLV